MNEFALYSKGIFLCFRVQNIAPDKKTIKIFNTPIQFNDVRDLIKIRGIGESEIKASLLKGEIRHKLLAKEIRIICSDLDLVTFNDDFKNFLVSGGIVIGLDPSGVGLTEDEHEQLFQLIHYIDSGPTSPTLSGSYKETVPFGNLFPSLITWYTDVTKTKKIVEKIISYNSFSQPSTITWNMYDTGGISTVRTILDSFTYINDVFEASRIRTII